MKKPILAAILSATLAAPALSHAETLKDWLMQSQVSGNIRSYYFNQLYGGSSLPDKYAYSLGGMLRVQTAPVYGISAAVAFYTANDLGANDTGGGQSHLDPLLMGDRTSLNVLGAGLSTVPRPVGAVAGGEPTPQYPVDEPLGRLHDPQYLSGGSDTGDPHQKSPDHRYP